MYNHIKILESMITEVTYRMQEGVYDPGIFKAVFCAGGPGSGKTYVVSATMGGLGLKVVNSDDVFEWLLGFTDIPMDFTTHTPEQTKAKDAVRKRAKDVTLTKQQMFLANRMGMIIDGTGAEYGKIKKLNADLIELGYDTAMVFVDTHLDVSMKRNLARNRKVDTHIVKDLWYESHDNLPKYQALFGNDFILVENDVDTRPGKGNSDEEIKVSKEAMHKVWMHIMKLARAPIKNPTALEWMKNFSWKKHWVDQYSKK